MSCFNFNYTRERPRNSFLILTKLEMTRESAAVHRWLLPEAESSEISDAIDELPTRNRSMGVRRAINAQKNLTPSFNLIFVRKLFRWIKASEVQEVEQHKESKDEMKGNLLIGNLSRAEWTILELIEFLHQFVSCLLIFSLIHLHRGRTKELCWAQSQLH